MAFKYSNFDEQQKIVFQQTCQTFRKCWDDSTQTNEQTGNIVICFESKMMLLRQQIISKCNLFHSQESSVPLISSKQDKIAILNFNSQTVDKTEFVYLKAFNHFKITLYTFQGYYVNYQKYVLICKCIEIIECRIFLSSHLKYQHIFNKPTCY